jgi:WhiB family redox-sensing transcriptional regulator
MTSPTDYPSAQIRRGEFESIGAHGLNYYGQNGEALNLSQTNSGLSVVVHDNTSLRVDEKSYEAPWKMGDNLKTPSMKIAAVNYVHWHHWLGEKILDLDGLSELILVTNKEPTVPGLIRWLIQMAYIEPGNRGTPLLRRTFPLRPITSYIDERNPPPAGIKSVATVWQENGYQRSIGSSRRTTSSPKKSPKPKSKPKTLPEPAQQIVVPAGGHWRDFANCLGVDPDLFFPERGASTREAKEVCRGCVVREDCLEYALANNENFGIWGGKTVKEFRRIKRQRALARAGVDTATRPAIVEVPKEPEPSDAQILAGQRNLFGTIVRTINPDVTSQED